MKRKYQRWLFASSIAGALYLLLDSLLLEKYFFQVKTFDIGNSDRKEKLRLLLLTDLHFRENLWPYHYKLANKVNALKPDLIMITGDTLDRTGKICPMDKFFSLLDRGLPKVAIPGNHDYKAEADISLLEEIYQKYNCRLLVNSTETFTIKGKKLVITGLDDFIESESQFKKAVNGVKKEEHHFLLIHSPLQQEKVKEKIQVINQNRDYDQQIRIRYIFAGHNHGGQVRLPGYVPKLPVKSGDYVNGWYNTEEPFLYVSRGFGTSTVPFRFGARAEITLFNYYV